VTADRAHETVLSFRYPSQRRARLVGDALEPEVGEIDDARSAATVSRDGDAVGSASPPTISSLSAPGSTAGHGWSKSLSASARDAVDSSTDSPIP